MILDGLCVNKNMLKEKADALYNVKNERLNATVCHSSGNDILYVSASGTILWIR